ncbi:cobaltochelatase subunit CobN [Crocosphaera watsonii]|uniref:CobN component of cobalt chelatase involved in B12 biosynthesis n=2 Tax=Crocosphaera watsonii TaxID=263511 RepID=G5IY47_CROWT|nr:cobaltochelatase subunit CobN [Crocosphaera watsonii]EHJ15136.1 CobN component of cobalt chelatase involved in B12 biosynthesis [Crocosphaera watsonii WH 0003]CCQ55783.1 CobN component of cobalt chelatase involved in B12 biosynthesis [Crocosphaera watsonii WH 0005]
MHRIAATPGGWSAEQEGVIFIEQNSAPIIFLSSADTDIQSLATCLPFLPDHFPAIRATNILQLQQQLSIDTYAEEVLSQSKVIILRLLGGRSYWPYGLEVIKEVAELNEVTLFILPGDDNLDETLMSHSTVTFSHSHKLWRYLTQGGQENWLNGLKFISDLCWQTNYNPVEPTIVPDFGVYKNNLENKTDFANIVILFYRSHYLAGNLQPIDALCKSLFEKQINPIPLFISSLRDLDVQNKLIDYCQSLSDHPIPLILNTTSFSLGKIDDNSCSHLWQILDIPILQVIFSSGTKEQWLDSFQGLNPRDVAMNIALPEVDGKIITRAVSFKSVKTWNEQLETDVIVYESVEDRLNFVSELAANFIKLNHTPVKERKIALILANYPNKDGRIANGVGLDTPASCINILQALQEEGYSIKDIPRTGDELIQRLTQGITNDPESKELRPVNQSISCSEYEQYFQTLPLETQQEITQRWGDIPEVNNVTSYPISGIQLGNIFIGIQPSRGYDFDPSLNYHAPDLEPTPHYLAYYYWLKHHFQAAAIIHVGKHGNLEWLPGKSLALSSTCYPEITLATIPNFYPFIVNDPGEGSQAKRRSHAVILDHLTPPLTRAELYGNLEQLETLIDEYYEAQTLDPKRLKIIGDRITSLVTETNLNQDLGINSINNDSLSQFVTIADGYLCELKEAQIRDGLHILGSCPKDTQLRDLVISITRYPSLDRMGLITALATDFNLDVNPLTANLEESFSYANSSKIIPEEICFNLKQCRIIGDVIEVLETYAQTLVENLINSDNIEQFNHLPCTQKELNWSKTFLLPNLYETPQEITNLLRGLNGKYVPSGASGTPTRGRPEVLPTGRNFYSVDIRAIPTQTAWDVGRKAAETLIERYTQDNGEYPQTLAISIWGTSTMRTGGDDIAQVLALLGVQPIWDGLSRRVVDYEILKPSVLGRPRVDVTVRVSGFFRDSFPNLLQLLYKVIKDVSSLEESKSINPLAAKVEEEKAFWQQQGLTEEQAKLKSGYRIFGSKPGAYGAGLQGLIEAQNWQNEQDLANAYINWSCYAYDQNGVSRGVPEVFERRLKQLQIVLHNQDNREHDLLDSDDYYQFQGGLTVAVRALTGKNPETYFGDNAIAAHPKVRRLKEEIARVYRSRVINPKWIKGVMRHGYKGAFEMSATVDYLFAYDATANCVEDFMYQGVAEAYLFDETVQQFIQEKNPWALRDMAERLLEANQRGLWQDVDSNTLDNLRSIVHDAEGKIEEK